jgi:hypothetical protein
VYTNSTGRRFGRKARSTAVIVFREPKIRVRSFADIERVIRASKDVHEMHGQARRELPWLTQRQLGDREINSQAPLRD